MKRTLFFLLLLAAGSSAPAQKAPAKKGGWHLLDPSEDRYMGISLNKAYELLKDRKSSTVIVAVIDSGIDTAQEDLRPVLWTNPGEVPGNGKDDDGNGYPDDVHGWNFLGSPSGENLARNTYETARVYHGWKDAFEGKEEKDIPADQRFLFSQWKRAAALIQKDHDEAARELPNIKNFINALQQSSKLIEARLRTSGFGQQEVKALQNSPEEPIARSADLWADVFSRSPDRGIRSTAVIREVTDYQATLEGKIRRKTEKPDDLRGALVKDRYNDISDRFYGNNNLTGGSGDHGTSVAGVIGASRSNGLGIDGIADNVRIMGVRAFPGGDEHDKDIALAIRYAVDNGAAVINISLGKPVSPYKAMVDDAIRYAASKGVLIVHAAGNDGLDLSKDPFYPSPFYLDGKRIPNLLTVGASGDPSTGGYAAPFSNYSREWVDLFAPGMYIYSTASGNRYNGADGTSLASPVVAGVAALLKSYFPKLTPEQLVRILTTSGTAYTGKVTKPGTEDENISFSELSSSGRIVNAFGAVKAALQMEK